MAAVGACGVQISRSVGWDHTSLQRQLEWAVLGAQGCIRIEHWLRELREGHQPVRIDPAEKYFPVSHVGSHPLYVPLIFTYVSFHKE